MCPSVFIYYQVYSIWLIHSGYIILLGLTLAGICDETEVMFVNISPSKLDEFNLLYNCNTLLVDKINRTYDNHNRQLIKLIYVPKIIIYNT